MTAAKISFFRSLLSQIPFQSSKLPGRLFHLVFGAVSLIGGATTYAAQDDISPEVGISLTESRLDVDKALGWLPGESIDPHYGSLTLRSLDLSIPGNGGLELGVQRIYHVGSSDSALGITPFGRGWNINYGTLSRSARYAGPPPLCARQHSSQGPSVPPVFQVEDGKSEEFHIGDDNIWRSQGNWRMVCASDGSVTLTSPNGISYLASIGGPRINPRSSVFSTSLLVSRISDTKGNWIQIDYHPYPQLPGTCGNYDYACWSSVGETYQPRRVSRVTANDGRTITFNYKKTRYLLIEYWMLDTISDGTRTVTYKTNPSLYLEEASLSSSSTPTIRLDKYTYSGNTLGTWQNRLGALVEYQFTGRGTISACTTAPVDVRVGVSQRTMAGETWRIDYAPGIPDTTVIQVPTQPITTYTFTHTGFRSIVMARYIPGEGGEGGGCSLSATGIERTWGFGLMKSATVSGGALTSPARIDFEYSPAFYSSESACLPYSPSSKMALFSSLSSLAYCIRDGSGQTSFPYMRSRTVTQDGGLTLLTTYENPTAFRSPQRVVEAGPTGSRVRTVSYDSDITNWLIDRATGESLTFVPPPRNVPPPTNPCAINPAACL